MSLLRNLLVSVILLLALVLASWVWFMPGPELRGTWRTQGYGLILDIRRSTINLYQITAAHCLRDMRVPAHLWMLSYVEGARFSASGDRLTLDVDGTLNPIEAERIDALPGRCTTTAEPDAPHVFDVLWAALDEHYPFFDLHGVDWDARRALRPMPGASEDELWATLQAALEGLDDGHTYIARPGEVHSPASRPDWHLDRHLVRDTTLAIAGPLTEVPGTGLSFGRVAPDIGYVYMAHMNVRDAWGAPPGTRAAEGFAQVAAALRDTRGLILDLRYNPGGSDDVALGYASFFTSAPRLAFTKSTRTLTGESAPFDVMQTPVARPLDQPVILLTTAYTSSAAEIFTLTLQDLPQVTTLGTTTSGGLSDVLVYRLPNGWELGLSHQTYRAPDGTLYEGRGIPPMVDLPTDPAAFRLGQDPILAAAIERLAE